MNGSHYKIDIIISGTVQPTTTTTKSHTSYILIFWKIKSFMWVYSTKYIFFDWNSKNFHCSAAVIIKCSAKAKLPRSAGSFFLCMMKKNYFQFQNIGQQLYSRHRQTMHLPNAFRFIHMCMLDILFSSNHNINKSSYGAFIFGLQTL